MTFFIPIECHPSTWLLHGSQLILIEVVPVESLIVYQLLGCSEHPIGWQAHACFLQLHSNLLKWLLLGNHLMFLHLQN